LQAESEARQGEVAAAFGRGDLGGELARAFGLERGEAGGAVERGWAEAEAWRLFVRVLVGCGNLKRMEGGGGRTPEADAYVNLDVLAAEGDVAVGAGYYGGDAADGIGDAS
jgi:hypothetical protein